MTVHLLRLAVRIESIEDLKLRQADRLQTISIDGEQQQIVRTLTRNVPKRADELTDGGSIYWVIKRFIRVRQQILGIEEIRNTEGKRRCALMLAPELVPVEARPQKAFQGWRYYRPEDAPPDIGPGGEPGEDLPSEMAEELRDLGLI